MSKVNDILDKLVTDILNEPLNITKVNQKLSVAVNELANYAKELEKNQRDPEDNFGDAQGDGGVSGEKVAEAVLESYPSPSLDFTGTSVKNLNISFTNYTNPEKGEKGDTGAVGYTGAMGMQGPPGPKGDTGDSSISHILKVQGKVGNDGE